MLYSILPCLDDPDEVASKVFLDSHIEPWSDVTKAWKKTNKMRHRELFPVKSLPKKKKTDDSHSAKLGVFINNWSSLKAPRGYSLVRLDFDDWFPESRPITERKLDNLLRKLFTRISSRHENDNQIRWIAEIRELQRNINSEEENENKKNISRMKLLAFVLPPTGRGSPTDKTSVLEVFESTIIMFQVFSVLNRYLQCYKLTTFNDIGTTKSNNQNYHNFHLYFSLVIMQSNQQLQNDKMN